MKTKNPTQYQEHYQRNGRRRSVAVTTTFFFFMWMHSNNSAVSAFRPMSTSSSSSPSFPLPIDDTKTFIPTIPTHTIPIKKSSTPATTIMSQQEATTFVHTWFNAWKQGNIEDIMSPFDDTTIEFHSPMIKKMMNDVDDDASFGILYNKASTQSYFQTVLDMNGNIINKDIINILVGINSIVVYYHSRNNGMICCDVFFLDPTTKKIQNVLNNYRSTTTNVESYPVIAQQWISFWNNPYMELDSLRYMMDTNVELTSPFLQSLFHTDTIHGVDNVMSYFEYVVDANDGNGNGGSMQLHLVDALQGIDSIALLYQTTTKSSTSSSSSKQDDNESKLECLIMELNKQGKITHLHHHHHHDCTTNVGGRNESNSSMKRP